jgi:hypothetical protein
MVFAVVMMMPAPVVMVMSAALGFVHQSAVKICGGKRLHRGICFARPDLDAFLGEDGQRPPANAANNDDLRALLAQPARKEAGGVWRRLHRPDADDFPLLWVCLYQRELSAAAKVSVKPAFGCGNCDGNHLWFFVFVGTGGVVATRMS